MSERRSRRNRGERPELVPPKSDEEPDLGDDYVDENGNKIAMGAIRGRRRGRRGKNKDLGNVIPKGSSSSLSLQSDKKPQPKKPAEAAAPTKKRRRGRPPKSEKKQETKKPIKAVETKKPRRRGRPPLNRRSPSPTPSQSSVPSSVSASASVNQDDDDPIKAVVTKKPRRRGRPPLNRSRSPTPSQSSVPSSVSASMNQGDDDPVKVVVAKKPRRRGRPPLNRGPSPAPSQSSVPSSVAASMNQDNVAVTKKPRRRGRPPLNRSPSPVPSQSSVPSSVSASASASMNQDDDDTMDSRSSPVEADDSNDSNDSNDSSSDGDDESDDDNDSDDDAERDTEDDAPKEALTGKKKAPRKQTKKQQSQTVYHPRYKNVVKLACRHCGKLLFSQGIKLHERFCMPVYTPREDSKNADGKMQGKNEDSKKADGNIQGKKKTGTAKKTPTKSKLKQKQEVEQSVSKVQTKKRKRKMTEKGPESIVAATDDDSLLKDDKASTAKANGKTANDTKTDASEGKVAKDNNQSGKDPPSELPSSEQPKRKRRKKKSDSKEEEKGAGSNVEDKASDDESPNSSGENPRKKIKEPKKVETLAADKSLKESGRAKGSQVESTTTESTMVSKGRKKSSVANKGSAASSNKDDSGKGKEKANANPAKKEEKKKVARNTKGSTTKTKKKMTPITDFFSPKKGSSKQQIKAAASGRDGDIKSSNKSTARDASHGAKTKGASISTAKQKSESALITTDKKNDEKEESSKAIGKEKGQKVPKKIQDSVSKTAAAKKKDRIATVPNMTSKVEPEAKPKSVVGVRKEASSLSKAKSKVGSKEISSKEIDKQSSNNIEDTAVSGRKNDFNKSMGEEKIAEGMVVQKKENNQNKLVASTRPTRKRKLTPKAAEAAATLGKTAFNQDEEKSTDSDSDSDGTDGSDHVGAKKAKTEQDGDRASDNSPAFLQASTQAPISDANTAPATQQKEGKAGIVEAAKSAAAATLAAFSIFSAKPKSSGGSDQTELETESTESVSKTDTVEITPPSTELAQDNDYKSEGKEGKSRDIEVVKASANAPTATGAKTSKPKDSMSISGDERTKLSKNISSQTTPSTTTTSQVTTGEKVEEPPKPKAGPPHPTVHEGKPSKEENATKPPDDGKHNQRIENEKLDLKVDEGEKSMETEDTIGFQNKEDVNSNKESLSLTQEKTRESQENPGRDRTDPLEIVESVSGDNKDLAPMNKIDNSSVQEEKPPIVSEEANKGIGTSDPDKMRSSERDTSTHIKKPVEIQDSTSSTEVLTQSTNDNHEITGMHEGDEKHLVNASDGKKRPVKEAGIEDRIHSSNHDLEMEEAIRDKHDCQVETASFAGNEKTNKEAQKSEEVRAKDERDEECIEATANMRDKKLIVKKDETESIMLADRSQDIENSSKKVEKGDTKDSSNDVAEAKGDIKGTDFESKQDFRKESAETREMSHKESVPESLTASKPQILPSADVVEDNSKYKESEREKKTEAPNESTGLSDDENSTFDATKMAVNANNTSTATGEVPETNIQMQSTESNKDASMASLQLSGEMKGADLNTTTADVNTPNAEEVKIFCKPTEEPIDGTNTPRAETTTQERVENLTDKNETTSLVDAGDISSEIRENKPVTATVDSAKDLDMKEAPLGDREGDDASKRAAKCTDDQDINISETCDSRLPAVLGEESDRENHKAIGSVVTDLSNDRAAKSENELTDFKGNARAEISSQGENVTHGISSVPVNGDDHIPLEDKSSTTQNGGPKCKSKGQESASNEADSVAQVKNLGLDSNSIEENKVADPREDEESPEREMKLNEQSQRISLEQKKTVLSETGLETVESTGGDRPKLVGEEDCKFLDIVTTGVDVNEDAVRKDVSSTVESLLDSVESRVNDSLKDATHMDIDDPSESYAISSIYKSQKAKSKDIDKPIAALSAGSIDVASEELVSSIDANIATESIVKPEDDIVEEEIKLSWVSMSKVSRQSAPAKDSPTFIGYDQNKMNRVKLLLYTTGSQIHRGRGFERIFGMYWDALCLRLSSPLNRNVSKHCDQAISVFLKSSKLRRIHNKFVMSIMRRALKTRVPYSTVSEHVPAKWQDRVKVPRIVTPRQKPKKKKNSFHDLLKDELLQISDVPHLDESRPYKEQWEPPVVAENETQQNHQEGPAEPIASSCIPGALVVDPFLRETVEASGMKVTDNAMWLLTVALKEHIKNVLNDSIEYKRGLKKGTISSQAIHYPNVLASTSNKNRKITKGKPSATSLDSGRKKRINSIDLFAALNMLPSGQPSSIGGSISRMSLEQTFLSGFNSIPAFDTGHSFKDVQSFVSTTITAMAKERKLEEKKVKASHAKSTENQTSVKSRQTKPTSRPEDLAKTPSPHQASLQTSAKVSESIVTSIPILDSPPLISNLSPTNVQTPVLDSSSPKIDVSEAIPQKEKDVSSVKTPSGAGSKGIESKTSEALENKAAKAEKPIEKTSSVALPSQPVPQKGKSLGAGRGAKNLAALMARAAESGNRKDSVQGGEIDNQTTANAVSTENKDSSSTEAAKSETNTSDVEKSKGETDKNQSLQANVVQTKQNSDSSKNGESKIEPTTADASNTGNTDGGGKDSLPVPPRQPIAPVRRGKGKGFGSKDLAAMRARSMTTQPAGDQKSAE